MDKANGKTKNRRQVRFLLQKNKGIDRAIDKMPQINTNDFMDYDKMKDKLVMEVVSAEAKVLKQSKSHWSR